ncbi:MAG: hypothetical protein ABFD07_17905 [Methanobacterium sp.]
MTMGTAQKQNIAIQHRIWNQNEKPVVMDCITWRNHIFKQMLRDGARIQYCENPVLFVITWPGKEPIEVTPKDIEAEWRRVHLRQKPEQAVMA